MGTLIVDACQLITFGNAGALSVVSSLQLHRVVVGSRADSEVVRDPAAAQLRAALATGSVTREAVDLAIATEQTALAGYDARPAFRGRGDAEVLALAVTRGYIVGSDDRPMRSFAAADCGGRVASSVDILRWAVRESRMSVADAVALLERLDVADSARAQAARQRKTLVDLF
jgi:hypothetical protein